MKLARSFLSIALVLAAAGAAGCKEDPPPAKPEPKAADSANAKARPRPSAVAPLPKVDPASMKDYRVDVCYFGTLTLKQARDAYLASLGKDEPSEKKLPSFGTPPPPAAPAKLDAKDPKAPDAKPTPGPAGKTDKAAPAKPTPRETSPAGSANAGKPGEMPRPPMNFLTRAPHERNARACTVAAGLKEPALADIDAALAAFAPYAVELAKNLAAAQNYYQREEYKKDSFEKGKELHKKLVADFAKLDELHDKLGAAIADHRGKTPADASKYEEGQKVAMTAFDDARAVMLGLISKKIDVEAHKAAVKKLEGSAEALKTFGTSNQADPWPKIMNPALEGFLRTLKEAEAKITDKGIDPEVFLPVITSYTSVIESKHRALSRSLIAKGQAQPGAVGAHPAVPGMPAQPAIPAPAKPQEEPANE